MSYRIQRIGRKSGGSVSDTVNYFVEATAKYHMQGTGEPNGYYIGKAAGDLGFGDAPISKQALENLLRGKHPKTGEPLVRGAGEKHRAGYEVVLAPSKDVSVLWGLCDNKAERRRIEKVLDEANRKAFERLEQEMYTRLGMNGTERQKAAGGVAACFRHGSSRKGDPHVHYHNLIANMVVCQDGTVRTLEDSRLFEVHDLMDAVFQREVAKGLRNLGYQLDEAKPADGGKPVMVVKGIPESIRTLFSKRDADIEKVVKAEEAKGKTISSKMHDAISRTTKDAKGIIDRNADFKDWTQQAKAAGYELSVKALKAERQPEPFIKTDKDIVNDLLRMQSVFSFGDLETAVARVAMYDQTQDNSPSAVQERVRRILRSEELMPLQGRTDDETLWTTRERRAVENHAIAWAKETESDRTHAKMVSVQTFDKTLSDTKESIRKAAGKNFKEANWERQEASVRHIVLESGQCCILKGVAGGGKSSTMKVAVDAFAASGMKVFGVATSNMAAKNLEAESGAKSCSIALMLTNIENGKSELDSKSVLIVDEAGMVGSVAMASLMQECRSKGAKIILAGEKEQIQAVEAGGLMAHIEDGLEHIAELLDINRQRNEWHKTAVMDMRNGEAEKALQAFEDNGLIVVKDDKDEVLKAAVDGWLQARKDGVDESKLLMLAATRAEVRRLNELTRRSLQDDGAISRNNVAVVVRVNEQEGIKSKYDIREERQFAEGEKIVFKTRYKDLGVVNGTTATIKELSKGRDGVASFVVELDGGKTVSFKSDKVDCFDTSYACTTHAAQGRTVERSFFVASAGGGAGGGMLDRHLSYVAISRSKGDTTIYCTTEDRQDLPADMKRERLKDTTLDYAEKIGDREKMIHGDHSKRFLVAETLTQAIEWNQYKRLEELLNEHPDFIGQAEVKSGNTPLHFAVLREDARAVEILLQHGAEADRANNYGFTPRTDAEERGLAVFDHIPTIAPAMAPEKTADAMASPAAAKPSKASNEATAIRPEPDQPAVHEAGSSAGRQIESKPLPAKPTTTVADNIKTLINHLESSQTIDKHGYDMLRQLAHKSDGQPRDNGSIEAIAAYGIRKNREDVYEAAMKYADPDRAPYGETTSLKFVVGMEKFRDAKNMLADKLGKGLSTLVQIGTEKVKKAFEPPPPPPVIEDVPRFIRRFGEDIFRGEGPLDYRLNKAIQHNKQNPEDCILDRVLFAAVSHDSIAKEGTTKRLLQLGNPDAQTPEGNGKTANDILSVALAEKAKQDALDREREAKREREREKEREQERARRAMSPSPTKSKSRDDREMEM